MADDLVESRLALRPMGGIDKAPPTLSFDRPREIRLPWADFAKSTRTDAEQSLASAADALKAYFEESWGLQPQSARSKAEVENILATGRLATQSLKEDGGGRFVPLQADEAAESGTDYADGTDVFAQHSSGRWYRLLSDGELAIESFTTKDLYKAAWASVVGIELVTDTAAGEAASTPTSLERIDLRAPFIEARYKELALLRNIAAAANAAAKAAYEAAATEMRVTDEHKQNYFATARELEQFEQALNLLARQASEMGYTLFVEPIPKYKLVQDAEGNEVLATTPTAGPVITMRPIEDDGSVGDSAKKAAEFGRLYRRTVEQRSYTPTQTVFDVVGWLFPRIRRRTIKLPKVTQSFDVHVEVDTLREPHRERIEELRALGLDVHVCTLTDHGYETESGTPLEVVMMQCESDEAARLNTVIFIPGYDFRLTGERVLTGYSVFHHPVAGSAPVAFPGLSILESLEYRTSWLQTEVGELVKSINLAPGERREITVTRSFQQETTESKTASSVFDLASSESTDLATELERTARNETDITDQMSASASASYSTSASGSYSMGPASASASMSASASATASASRAKSVKNVGTDMAKSAQKAARSINQSKKEEVSSSTTSSTTVSTSDTSVSVIENVNQGRTLNLMMYRLYNRYVGKLFLKNLRLTVRFGSEIIAGSGIFPEHTFSVNELRDVVLALGVTPLPVKANERSEWELRLAILREIGNLIDGEYAKLTTQKSEAEPVSAFVLPESKRRALATNEVPSDAAEAAKDVIKFGEKLGAVVSDLRSLDLLSDDTSRKATGKDQKDLEAEFNKQTERLIAELAPMEVTGLPVNETELLVVAEGLFMDAQVGANPSTEPYFERMRDAEVAMRLAEVDRVRSEAARNGALARFMGVQGLGTGANMVIAARVTGNTLEVELVAPLDTGDWRLEHNERQVSGVLINPGGRIITHNFGDKVPPWATDADFSLLELANDQTGARISFANPLTVPVVS